MTVITHAYTPLMDVDAMSEQDCREALKDVLRDGFAKDQELVELKTISHKLDSMLVKLIDLFIAGHFSKLHASCSAWRSTCRSGALSNQQGGRTDEQWRHAKPMRPQLEPLRSGRTDRTAATDPPGRLQPQP
ncbi:hypothetical protein [Pseudomonas aeruginosa]|uniref:hypothetical protein n=1 Tax=Pseudomonas aeruginosa TaxID=287 RepID=UPI001F5DB731|nr:hypothetical protein [Pseudomonas aeruginosa]